MANADLVHCILAACEKYRRHEISIAQLQEALENSGTALEGAAKSVYSKVHDFSNDLERIQFACLQEKQYGEACAVIDKLQKYLESSPSM